MSSTLVTQVQEKFFTYAEAAKALGISKVSLWRWIRDGKLETYRIGREVLIEKTEVERLRK